MITVIQVKLLSCNLLLGKPSYQRETPLLQELNWLPVFFQSQFKVLIIIYKILYSLDPGYLKYSLVLQISDWPLRSAMEDLLRVPPIAEIRLMGIWERAFSVVVPWLWNSLLMETCLVSSLLLFQRILEDRVIQERFSSSRLVLGVFNFSAFFCFDIVLNMHCCILLFCFISHIGQGQFGCRKAS